MFKSGHTEINASTKKCQRFYVPTMKLSQCTTSLTHFTRRGIIIFNSYKVASHHQPTVMRHFENFSCLTFCSQICHSTQFIFAWNFRQKFDCKHFLSEFQIYNCRDREQLKRKTDSSKMKYLSC